MNIILLLDTLGNQLALIQGEFFLAAHYLTFLVLVHINSVECIDNTIPTQHLAYGKEENTKQTT